MTTAGRWRARASTALLMLATVVVGLGIGIAGLMKFVRADDWRALFASWGYPTWFSTVVGCFEVLGAVALFVPRLALAGVGLLSLIMVSALVTLLMHPGGRLGWGATPTAYLCILAIIAMLRWRRREGRA